MEWLTHLGLENLFTAERTLAVVKAATVLIAGLFLARVVGRAVARMAATRLGSQNAMLVRRLVFWSVLSLAGVSALHQLGVNLGVLLGAAGILTVAIGFAAQTSASNFISGLFLIAERPFAVGDYITIADVTGEVLSIDLLAVKVRTFDNSLVRIPNENIIKDRLTNLTHFPIRRVDINVGAAYKEDIARVRDTLLAVADSNPDCLDEPRPQFFFDGFGDSSLDMRLCVWVARNNFFAVKNTIQLEIKRAFDNAGIEIPFPHRSLYAGSATDPFPVRLVAEDGERPPGPPGQHTERS